MSHPTSLSINLDGIRLQYVEKLRAQYPVLVALRSRIEIRPQENALSEIASIAHKMRGSAATLGFEKLGTASEICETGIVSFRNHPNDPEANRVMLARIRDFCAEVRSAIS